MKLTGELSPTAKLTREQIALDVKCLSECKNKHTFAYRGQVLATLRDCREMGMTAEADDLKRVSHMT